MERVVSDLLSSALAATDIPLAHRDVGDVNDCQARFEITTARMTGLTFSGASAPGVFL